MNPFRLFSSSVPRLAGIGLCGLVFTGCAYFGDREGPVVAEPSTPRSELVVLNLREASGWVAFREAEDSGARMENYRMVVIHQDSGKIMYDSIVPLAADLRTHGFEMEARDPRLLNLAHNVDRRIIEPMEAYERARGIEPEVSVDPAPAPDDAPPAPKEPREPPATQPAASTHPPEKDAPPPAPPGARAPEMVEAPASGLSGAVITAVEGEVLTLALDPPDALDEGDRFFLRHPPKVIALPGMEEDYRSRGEVAGLARILTIENGVATAKLLSGEVPDEVYLEPETDDSF